MAAQAPKATSATQHVQPVVLVVGDSLVEQSADALRDLSTSAVQVRVTDRMGTAPCDWTSGDFDAALAAAHPTVVVLAFTGNGGAAAGCVDHTKAYSLEELLDNYRQHLTELANRASAIGASVVLSVPPARNPAVPAPPAVPTEQEQESVSAFYGFQGVPEIGQLYANLVHNSGGRWTLSDTAAQAVSPGSSYQLRLPCATGESGCTDGTVQVRAGGGDAIHLDRAGHGARRFARGLVSAALTLTGGSTRV